MHHLFRPDKDFEVVELSDDEFEEFDEDGMAGDRLDPKVFKVDEMIEAAGDYMVINTGDNSLVLRETMKDLEKRLDPRNFQRVHRSTIVNVDRIQELRSSFNGEYVIFLHDRTRLTLSRGYREKLQERLG